MFSNFLKQKMSKQVATAIFLITLPFYFYKNDV